MRNCDIPHDVMLDCNWKTMATLNKEYVIESSNMSNHYIPISSAKDGTEGNVTTNCSSNSKSCDSHGENDSTSNSTPPSVTSSVGTRLTDYFEKMSEMQKKAFEKLYESASNGPCHSSNSSDGPCHALVVCEQSLEQNFKDMASKRKQKFLIFMFIKH